MKSSITMLDTSLEGVKFNNKVLVWEKLFMLRVSWIHFRPFEPPFLSTLFLLLEQLSLCHLYYNLKLKEEF